jgi:hypothetical protein
VPYAGTYVYAEDRPTVLVDPSGMGAIWHEEAPDCEAVVSASCISAWLQDRPAHKFYVAAEVVAAGAVCLEGGAIGAVAGPVGAVGGCAAGVLAFHIASTNAKHQIEEEFGSE